MADGTVSRSGSLWDNAALESFFSSLKIERTARRHSTPCYLGSVEFENLARLLEIVSPEPAAGHPINFS